MTSGLVNLIKRFFGTKTIVVSGKWVMTNCPFAKRTHPDRDDKRFSFGMTLNGFHCFTCGAKGSLRQFPYLLKQVGIIDDYVFYEMLKYVEVLKDYKGFERIDIEKRSKRIEGDSDWQELFMSCGHVPEDKAKILSLTLRDVKVWDIRYFPFEKGFLFPLRNKENKLIGVKVRIEGEKGRKFYYLGHNGCGKLWYGEHFPLRKDIPLFLVEGERDVILLSRYVGEGQVWGSLGQPTISMIQAIPSDVDLVLFFDNDQGGQVIKKKVLKHLRGAKRIYSIEDYEVKDPALVVEYGMLEDVLKKKIKRISL